MIEPWQIYLIGQLDQLGVALLLLGLALTGGTFFMCAISMPSCDLKDLRYGWRARTLTAIGALLLFASMLLPDSKTAAAMWVIPKIANNEVLQKDTGDIYKLAVEFVKDKLETDKKASE